MKCDFCENIIHGTVDDKIDAGWNWAEFKLRPSGKKMIVGCPEHKENFKIALVNFAASQGFKEGE